MRTTTVTHAFAAAIAPCDAYDDQLARQAVVSLGQDPDAPLLCAYCGSTAETWDHVHATVKDKKFSGHGHRLGNLLPCCKPCNSKKGNKSWRTFLTSLGLDASRLAERLQLIQQYLKRYEHLTLWHHEGIMRKLQFAALALLMLALRLTAQSTYGEIRGTISDATGAVVAGAKVQAKNADTGVTRSTTSDPVGNFAFLNLDAGAYEVGVENSGFRPAQVKGVAVRAREIARVDVKLEVSSSSTEVQVTTARQVIQTDMATIVDSRSSEQILKLPVNFRAGGTNSVFGALSYAPGVQTDSGGGSISLAGGMPFQTTATIDGISSINVRGNGIINEMFPSTESIDEIKISSVNNNAEFAQMGDVTTTSKAGTNALHGALFWYHQNGAMDARDFFSTRSGAPFKVSNDFGVQMGGPV